jgi:5-methylcytosine-specific restriction enzyme A
MQAARHSARHSRVVKPIDAFTAALGPSTPSLPCSSGAGGAGTRGRQQARNPRVRERNRKLVKQRKQQALKHHGVLACEVCGFQYASRYGALGADFIECHHRQPVSELLPGATTKISDLTLVCASCHRMLHRQRPWLTLEDLRQIIAASQP